MVGAKLYATHSSRDSKDAVDKDAEEWMLSALPSQLTGKIVADAGAGAGRWIPHFFERHAHKVIAIDQSAQMLHQIEPPLKIVEAKDVGSNINDDLILVHGDMTEVLNAVRSGIDVVFANFSLCTLQEPQPVLQAMHRSLVPGGLALITTNVIVRSDDAPTHDQRIRSADLQRTAPIDIRLCEHIRKELRIVLHFPAGDLPITDYAHAENDYAVHPALWDTIKADLVLPSGLSVIDLDDTALNERYYGSVSPYSISLRHANAQLAHLCLSLRKK